MEPETPPPETDAAQVETPAAPAPEATPADAPLPQGAAASAPPVDPAEPAALAERVQAWALSAWEWVRTEVLTLDAALQVAAVAIALLLGWALTGRARKLLGLGLDRIPEKVRSVVAPAANAVLQPFMWAAFLALGAAALHAAGRPSFLVNAALSLSLAGAIISLIAQFVAEGGLRTFLIRAALVVAALNAVGFLDDILAFLNRTGIEFGERLITLPFIVQAIAMTGLFFWAASWLGGQLQTRIETLPKVEPSLRILFSNAARVGLFVAAALMVLTGLGIDLSALAILGGAIGVGLGFGMQQIVANFISGVILLTDRSIKPDDVIEVDETYGVVKSLGLRYCSVITRDGKEHLIPNEMLVTDKVVNWSYSDKKVRIKRRVRVEYESDLRLACRLIREACAMTPRVLADPEPKALVMEFGEEAVEIEARFWIEDAHNGINNVSSDVMLNVWDKFKENGIDIPLRREEILIEPGSVIDVRMVADDTRSKPAQERE